MILQTNLFLLPLLALVWLNAALSRSATSVAIAIGVTAIGLLVG